MFFGGKEYTTDHLNATLVAAAMFQLHDKKLPRLVSQVVITEGGTDINFHEAFSVGKSDFSKFSAVRSLASCGFHTADLDKSRLIPVPLYILIDDPVTGRWAEVWWKSVYKLIRTLPAEGNNSTDAIIKRMLAMEDLRVIFQELQVTIG